MTEPYNPETYWDAVAAVIRSRQDLKTIAGDDEPYYRYKRKRFLKLLGTFDFTNKTVLEIGCGPGGNLDFVYNKGCKKITGVDVSQQMISLAEELVAGKEIDVIKINGKDLPFENKAFDVVFTSTVLQHNTNEEALRTLVQEICRVAKGEVFLFERIERKITGHESNVGRPVRYYESLLQPHGFGLTSKQPLPIQASYFVCGAIRKTFNRKTRREGEPLTSVSVKLENLLLPLTSILDRVIPSNRDLTLLRFKRTT